MGAVEIRNIQKSYGSLKTIHGVDVSVQAGEFTVLIGPSGCGKTTLLRMIAGLETITDGQLHIGDRLMNDVAAKDRDVAMVFQNYALYPHMTVAQNMGFSLKLRRAPKDEIGARVNHAAEILGLTALLQRYPKQLSGGQRQRVAMGRAIVRQPQVFLFDEPLSNLDAKMRVTMRTEIKSLQQRLKATTIYVTHDQVEAMTMADKIVVMNEGRIEQIGTPLELYDRPANTFVAGFIGSPTMNMLRGRVLGNVFATKDGLRLPLHQELVADHATDVIYGIRPENIDISKDGTGLPAKILVIEPMGSETQLALQFGGEAIVALVRERVGSRPGDTIHLKIDPRYLHFFDAGNCKRLDTAPMH